MKMSQGFDGRDLDRFEGMISACEAELLHGLAAHLGAGGIVEIGSWRGKSAIALALGAKANPLKPVVYCVEPHARFTGVYGGKFGPQDRAAFYAAMLESGCAEDVALVNLPSASAARAWPYRVGLIFIDGDHTEAAVEDDVAAWAPHLVDGGYLAFDDALDPGIGPAHTIARLLASGRYSKAAAAGKIVVLQKTPDPECQRQWNARATAVVQTRARAEAAGYDADFANARLTYGSFVSIERRYMYMETPKAACTSWKRLIVELEGASVHADRRSYHRETRLDMLIHQRQHVQVPTLLDVTEGDRAGILGGAGEWFVFALSRNPFSRLVSVFENKIRLGEPGYRHLALRYRHEDAREAFAAFVGEVAADPEQRNGDAHLCAQTDLLLVNFIPYRRIYHIENMADAVAALYQHLASRGQASPLVLERLNQSVARPWRSYFDEATAAIAAEAYAADFATFGYDPTDWRGGEEGFAEGEQERRLRSEIIARNEMIERLYGLLEAQALKD